MNRTLPQIITIALLVQLIPVAAGQQSFPIGEAWARTKVNAVIFRHNAICSIGTRQVTAYYDADGRVVLAERTHGSASWTLMRTSFTGHATDAHNSISIAFDGSGQLHMSWDHHGNALRYSRSTGSGSLLMGPMETMIGSDEDHVTYPEFYRLSDGDLLFFYRDGSSGNGNLVLNHYDTERATWHRVHDNLIDGEGQRNAYWQVAVGPNGEIGLSWVWRETGDVVTNHDIAYAVSTDRGRTWQTTTGDQYALPITEATAEYAIRIPQDSELANQTSMAFDGAGRPIIANFWREQPDAVPQYRLVMHTGTDWVTKQIGTRTLDFHRRGGGTKKPPVSRPLVLLDPSTETPRGCVLFRDQERGGGITVAMSADMLGDEWSFTNLTTQAVGQADPMIDPDIWRANRQIHLLSQFAGQGDFEKPEDVAPQVISVIEWSPPGR